MLKRIRIRNAIVILSFLIIFGFGVSFPFILKSNDPSLIVFCVVVCVLSFMVFFAIRRAPKLCIPTLKVSIDVKGKSYNDNRGERWFFESLESQHIDKISNYIQVLNNYLESMFSLCKDEKDHSYFLKQYNEQFYLAYRCILYRSFTKYRQRNYVKTPYTARNVEWEKYYSPSGMRDMISKYFGVIIDEVKIPELDATHN